ncbi:MAG: HEAT repeat domain-containing protein [Sandaracinaceae bacterium]|nr:hypothetical protein [Myxococcales bacterium]
MRASSFVVPLLTALLVAQTAAAQAAPSRDRVRQLLSGIEDVPSDADWQRLGDGALPVLIDLYADGDEAPYVRLRAVDAVAAFPRTATRTFLLAVAQAEGQSDLFVRQAVLALARGFGRAALSDLRPFLAHDEAVVREAAARALGGIGGDEATAALRARLEVERDRVVREALQGGLR